MRRGDELREHILWAAKEVFLEFGFERASMDIVALRAATSKRSLYAHFESKENLFLEILALVRGLFLGKLKTPSDYGDDPSNALIHFCGRYLEILLYESSIQMCRICMAETTRFPDGASKHFDLMFMEVHVRLSVYLKTTYHLPGKQAAEAAQRLMGQILYPRFTRALFGIDELRTSFDPVSIAPDFDLKPVRRAVDELVASLL